MILLLVFVNMRGLVANEERALLLSALRVRVDIPHLVHRYIVISTLELHPRSWEYSSRAYIKAV